MAQTDGPNPCGRRARRIALLIIASVMGACTSESAPAGGAMTTTDTAAPVHDDAGATDVPLVDATPPTSDGANPASMHPVDASVTTLPSGRNSRGLLALEPFRGDRFAWAKPRGWPPLRPAAPPPAGYEEASFAPSADAPTGLGPLRVLAGAVTYRGATQAKERLAAILAGNTVTVTKQTSCCLQTFSHWASADLDTGQAGALRFTKILVTANALGFGNATAIESVVTLSAATPEVLEAVTAEFITLNVAQSIGLLNALEPSSLQGRWESVAGQGADLIDSNGVLVGQRLLGEYRLYTFLPSGRYAVTSVHAFDGELFTAALIAEEAGAYQFGGGVLTLVSETCVGRSYRDGTLSSQGNCLPDMTPLSLRVEPRGADRFQMTGVAVVPSNARQPEIIVPTPKP